MHKLDRSSVPVPPCLVAPVKNRRYGDLHSSEKVEIRAGLLSMQKHRCAYCERRTGEDRDAGHIEHFRKQASNQTLDLTWSNLFWSCNDETTCGKHKDKCERPAASGPQAIFHAEPLIDPSLHDPEEFLLFLPDGTVRPREGLDTAGERRALETIRVLRIAAPFLRRSREDAVKPYIGAVDSLLHAGLEHVRRYLDSVQQDIEAAPFETVIKQYLRGLIT